MHQHTTMKDKVSIGIVGCGAHAQIAHIPNFKKHPQSILSAICDTDVQKIDYLSSKYNIPKRYQDFQELIEDEEIDAIVIATPNYLHTPMAISALKYGKHVLCETPMAISLDEAEEMAQTAQATDKKLTLSSSNRLRPDVQLLKKFIMERDLGDIYYVKAGWLIGTKEWILNHWRLEKMKSGGGAFLTLGTTLVDIATYLLKNKKCSTIFARANKKEPEAEVEDTALCIINFADDTLLTIEVGWSLLFEEDFLYCNVFGKKGAALLNPLKIQKELHNSLFNVTPTLTQKNVYKVSYEMQVQHFLDFLLNDVPPLLSYEDGMLMARITQAFYESAQHQELVRI